MRDHDSGGWKFARTIGLNQHTKAAHCAGEMWVIPQMNSNWKVWMASLIKSKHIERHVIFRSRLVILVWVALLSNQTRSNSRIIFLFFIKQQERKRPTIFLFLFVCYPNLKLRSKLTPSLVWDLLSPLELSWWWVSTATKVWNAPGSRRSAQNERQFCLNPFVFREGCLDNSNMQIILVSLLGTPMLINVCL